jgi:hypothetical protein
LGLGNLRDRLRIWRGRRAGFDNSPPSDDVAPHLAQFHLLGRGSGPVSFRGGKDASGGDLTALLGRLLCKSRICISPLYKDTVVRLVVCPATTILRLYPRSRASTGELGATTPTHRVAYPQLRCVYPKRWQGIHCSGHFGDIYVSTVTRRPQIWVRDRTLDTSGPRATDTMK